MGGGGGSTSTTTSGIAPEFMPYFEKGLGIMTNRLTSQFNDDGTLKDPQAGGIVAGMGDKQLSGLGAQEALARQAVEGKGIYNDQKNVQRMMNNTRGEIQAGRQGALGSARGDRAQAAAMADKGYQFQQARQQKAEAGAQSMQDVGTQEQAQRQKVLDAPYTEMQRFSNIVYGNAPQQSTTTQSGGK